MNNSKKMHDLEALRSLIAQWNANRLDLFSLSEPNEDLEFHGVMRFYFQDSGQRVATKCIRVSSTGTTKAVVDTLIEKFRPDMRMLSNNDYYALYEIHANGDERKLGDEEKPLLVQLNWHKDDREGRFLLRRIDESNKISPFTEPNRAFEDVNFKRKLSKREKKQLKKQEKLRRLQSNENDSSVAEKLYTEIPETSFTRSISNPEAVMRRRRQQKLEKKLQQFRSKDGGPDTGGTLKIYGESICKDVPYKTLLLSIRDTASQVVKEMLEKYGLLKEDPANYCLIQQVTSSGEMPSAADMDPKMCGSDVKEYILDDDECPLAILMGHTSPKSTIMFHVRRKPADYQPRKRKKKPLKPIGETDGVGKFEEDSIDVTPHLYELNSDGSMIRGGTPRLYRLLPNVTEVGSEHPVQSGQYIQLYAPDIQARHCVLAYMEGIVTVTPSSKDAVTYVNGQRIYETTLLEHGAILKFGQLCCYQFIDPSSDQKLRPRNEMIKNLDFHNSRHNFETTFDVDGNIETISTASLKDEIRSQKSDRSSGRYFDRSLQGVSPILPAVMELLEENEDAFLDVIISNLDPQRVQFKLAPTYTLYMAARFRASTHFLPDLTPQERAGRLTIMVTKVAALIQQVIADHRTEAGILAFWMANASELLHFLKQDRHLDAYSLDAQDILAESVQMSFRYLFLALQNDMVKSLPGFYLDHDDLREEESHMGVVLTLLSNTMALLRRCRVNAALTIQLFSQLFHFINMWLFNKLVMDPQANYCSSLWGIRLKRRLERMERWAEKQGLELAADCHLARIAQASHFLQAPKYTREDLHNLATTCFKLNSLQVQALLDKYHYGIDEPKIPAEFKMDAIKAAREAADELLLSDGRDVRLAENPDLQLPFLLPEDGYSCDIVRGVPGGLTEFLNPLKQAGLCRMTLQPASSGYWTIYMKNHFDGRGSAMRSASAMSIRSLTEPPKSQRPELMTLQLKKSNGGMGLSIVAAKGVGQPNLGIYIKSVVKGGAADLDGRLQSGDQLLTVDSQSLIGITQEKAAEILMRTGQIVTLEVAKQGAVFHGLATLLSQPSPIVGRGSEGGVNNRRSSERDIPNSILRERNSEFAPQVNNRMMMTSKSVPSLHSAHDETLRKPAEELAIQKVAKSGSIHSLVSRTEDNTRLNQTYHGPPKMSPKYDDKIIQEQYYQNIAVYQKGLSSSGSAPFLPQHNPSLGRVEQQTTHSSQIIYPNPELNTSLRERPASAFSRYPQESNSESNLAAYHPSYSSSNLPPPGVRHQTYGDQVLPYHYPQKSSNYRPQYYKAEEGGEMPPARPPLPQEVSQESPPPPPPTTTHPLYLQREQERNERNRELSSQKPYTVSGPWDREEREKHPLPPQEQARRQAAARAWRDQQIAALESIPGRTVKQEEQLHALRLEREFQKRVEEVVRNEDDDADCDEESNRLSEPDRNSLIRTVQEDLDRLEQQHLTLDYSDINRNKLTHAPNMAYKLEEVKMREMRKMQELELTRQAEQRILREAQRRQEEDLRGVNYPIQEVTYTAKTVTVYPDNQPEDFLVTTTVKHRAPNVSPYHHSYTLPASSTHSPYNSVPTSQPPPPERSSSYNALGHFQSTKPEVSAPKKTVSFGEDISHSQTSPKNQNPEKFFTDAEAILSQSPQTPETYSVNTAVTPGVIGAQEVYRDPRQRRLAAKQEEMDKQKIAGPEKLTFKEKMKMFAMESGEVESPRDKVKISRAQREIELNNTNNVSKLEAAKS